MTRCVLLTRGFRERRTIAPARSSVLSALLARIRISEDKIIGQHPCVTVLTTSWQHRVSSWHLQCSAWRALLRDLPAGRVHRPNWQSSLHAVPSWILPISNPQRVMRSMCTRHIFACCWCSDVPSMRAWCAVFLYVSMKLRRYLLVTTWSNSLHFLWSWTVPSTTKAGRLRAMPSRCVSVPGALNEIFRQELRPQIKARHAKRVKIDTLRRVRALQSVFSARSSAHTTQTCPSIVLAERIAINCACGACAVQVSSAGNERAKQVSGTAVWSVCYAHEAPFATLLA